MPKKLLLTLVAFIFVIALIHLCFAERLTITTYYPSPYGIYSKLLTKTFGVGDTNGDGQFDNNDLPATEGAIMAANRIRTNTGFSYQNSNGYTGTIGDANLMITVRGGIITGCVGAACNP